MIALWVAGVGCDEGTATPSTEVDFYALLGSPYAPAMRPVGEARVASSRSPEEPAGFHNRDWANYVRVDADLGTIFEEEGPGVITRLWFTQRSTLSAPAVEEDLVIRMWIDGEPIEWLPGRTRIGLRELTSGELEAWPRPWVAGPRQASGSFLVTMPIQFQHGARIALEMRDGLDAYWWVDWRKLSRSSVVRSFDGTLDDRERASLDHAGRVWAGDEAPPDSLHRESVLIAPHAASRVSIPMRGVLRSVTLEPANLPDLEVELWIDGLAVARAPAAQLFLTSPPAAPYRSALSAMDGGSGVLRLPTPVRTEASLRVASHLDDPVEAVVTIEWDDVEPPDDLGDLRVECTRVIGEEGANITVADVSGRGHVAGHSLRIAADGYGFAVLEGDPEIFADGRALLGTGIEDLFGGAHYFVYGPFAEAEHGLTGLVGAEGGYPILTMYRHMLVSGPAFDERLQWEYEVFDPGAAFDSCIYWYVD